MKHGLLFSLVTISLFAIAFLRGNTILKSPKLQTLKKVAA